MDSDMTSLATLSVGGLVAALSIAGCKKTHATADQPPSVKSPPAATAAGAGIRSDEDYVAQASTLLGRMTEIFRRGGTDCDKLADGIAALAADATMKSVQTYEKALAEAKPKFDAAARDEMKAFEDAAGPATSACQNHKKFNDAFAKLAG